MNLNDLGPHRDTIFLAEIGALIHDLGKLSEEFVNQKCTDKKQTPREWHHSQILEYDADNGMSEATTVKSVLSGCKLDSSISILDLVEAHHEKKWKKGTRDYSNSGSPHFIIKLLCASDKFDSEEDKGEVSNEGKQSNQCLKISNAFGYEGHKNVQIHLLKDYRKEIYKTLSSILKTPFQFQTYDEKDDFSKRMEEFMNRSLGETRRAANDVTIWQHSFMVASILKALIGQYYTSDGFREYVESIKGRYSDSTGWIWTRNGEKYSIKDVIREKTPFRILSVHWDFFEFVSQSHKIPDIIGRLGILNEIKRNIKNLIEVKLLLGNCIYEDEHGLHFLVPASFDNDNMDEVEKQVHEVFNKRLSGDPNKGLKGIITPYICLTYEGTYLFELLPRALESIKERTESSFRPKWIEDWKGDSPKKKLVCNICGKGAYSKDEKEGICEICKSIREMGRKQEKLQTTFIDDIAWNGDEREYENVALLVLNFDLENWTNGKNVKSLFVRNPCDYRKEILDLYDYIFYEKFKEDFEGIHALIRNIKQLSQQYKTNSKIRIGIEKQFEQLETKNVILVKYLLERIETMKSVKIDVHTIMDILENGLNNGNLEEFIDEIKKIDDMKSLEEAIFLGGAQANTVTNLIWGRENLEFARDVFEKVNGDSDIDIIAKSGEKFYQNIVLKNPSPSRLMRVWNNTREFFEGLDETICKESYEIKRYSLAIRSPLTIPQDTKAYELTIKSKSEEIAAEGFFDSTGIHIVTPRATHFIENNHDFEVEITDETWTLPTRTYTCTSNNSYATFRAYRSISISPDMFMFLISASKTPNILKKIKKEYMKVFGKVYGKLPLNISIVYFKRKMPFYTVLDSARRFLDRKETEKDTNGNEELTIEVKGDPEINDFVKIETDIGPISIPIKLGSGERDYYHPYLIVEDGQDAIQVENRREKHATLLKKGDKLKIHPSFFDFVFLDSNTRRFDISTENKKRPHPIFTYGPRPFYIEDIDSFSRIWCILERSCTTTQLNNFESLLLSKIDEWRLNDLEDLTRSEEFKKLAKASIKNILRIEEKDGPDFTAILDSVMSGKFFDVKELYHTILKRKLGGGENE
jgi:CRISPR-associated Csx11 family protein